MLKLAAALLHWCAVVLVMLHTVFDPSNQALAQDRQVREPSEPPPVASLVLARHRAAIGNPEGKTSVKLAGTITGTGIAPGSRFERYIDTSGRYYHQTLSGTTVVASEGWTGNTAFRTSRGRAVPLTPGRAAAVREHGVAFLGLHAATLQNDARTIEWSDFNESWHAKVQITLAPGNVRTELYDVGSGLLTLVARDRGLDADGKKEDKMVVFRAYVDFNGVKLPTNILEADGKAEWRLKVDSVRWNVPLPEAIR